MFRLIVVYGELLRSTSNGRRRLPNLYTGQVVILGQVSVVPQVVLNNGDTLHWHRDCY